ncbi:MAG: histidine phosphatase family protein [Bacteroidota bacterium]
MKTLLLIRHAKSDQSFFGNDFERPLNERGKTDAPVMAQRLLDKKIKIDQIVASPAKRTKKTSEIFSEVLKMKENDILLVSKLYHASPEIFHEVINELDDKNDVVAIISHNPGITYFVNEIAETYITSNMPTCAIYGVKIHCDKWSQFAKAKKEFLLYDFPKNI